MKLSLTTMDGCELLSESVELKQEEASNSILKQPLRPEKIGLAFQTMTKHGEIGTELRSYFKADPGYSFVEMDLITSGGENRSSSRKG